MHHTSAWKITCPRSHRDHTAALKLGERSSFRKHSAMSLRVIQRLNELQRGPIVAPAFDPQSSLSDGR
jgi:hypothetical protein